ncbi:hypothetical protein M9Y10_016677 [Tritrichomonas musculus]|uniref:DUF3447 domain-containing protein n=1 Tax=Tritrichomonas musculus TaxID=1915356 RepID=A0ABR2HWX0_9EUKA
MKPTGFFPQLNELDMQLQEFFENDGINESILYQIKDFIIKWKVEQNKSKLKIIFNLLSNITAYHHVGSKFYEKLDSIISIFDLSSFKKISPKKLFNIFSYNRRALPYLFDKQIIDSQFKKRIKKIHIDFINNFNYKTDNYQNETYIASLIREDAIDEFIIYANQQNINIDTYIQPSKFETNPILYERNVSLIEYAAFFGSIQIFRYLKLNNAELTSFLWIAAVHSNNPELIHEIEGLRIKPKDETYRECIEEAIKCHNNNVASYIIEQLTTKKQEDYFTIGFRYYDFGFFLQDLDYGYLFLFLFEYDYLNIVKLLINSGYVNPSQNLKVPF